MPPIRIPAPLYHFLVIIAIIADLLYNISKIRIDEVSLRGNGLIQGYPIPRNWEVYAKDKKVVGIALIPHENGVRASKLPWNFLPQLLLPSVFNHNRRSHQFYTQLCYRFLRLMRKLFSIMAYLAGTNFLYFSILPYFILNPFVYQFY
jgi:hypothetical protein